METSPLQGSHSLHLRRIEPAGPELRAVETEPARPIEGMPALDLLRDDTFAKLREASTQSAAFLASGSRRVGAGVFREGVRRGLAAPGLTASGLASQGLTASGLAAPGLAASGLASPGLTASGLASNPARPGLTGNPQTDAAALIERFKGSLGLDENGLGRALAALVRADPFGSKALVEQTFQQLETNRWYAGGDNKGQVAAHFMESLSDAQVEKLRGSTAGQAILHEADMAMRHRGITQEEAVQIRRLYPATGPRPTPAQIQEIQSLLDVGTPEARQKAIEKTIEVYHIDTDKCNEIKYDPKIHDYGTTDPFGRVAIGKRAFSSPAMLASTLGHECEVHAGRQLEDRCYPKNSQGGALNEIEAYDYEIENANRFGLTDSELGVAVSNRKLYYRRLKELAKQLADEKDYKSPWDKPF